LLHSVANRTNNEERTVVMPEFGSPFSGWRTTGSSRIGKLIRAIRFMIAAEYEAIQLYMQLAESTDNKPCHRVLRDIADEERVHAGEFLDCSVNWLQMKRILCRRGRGSRSRNREVKVEHCPETTQHRAGADAEDRAAQPGRSARKRKHE